MPCDEDYYYDWQREKAAHAETRSERDAIQIEMRVQLNEALAHQCTPAERKVLQEMAAMKHNTLSDVIRTSKFYKVCQAELAKRRGNI